MTWLSTMISARTWGLKTAFAAALTTGVMSTSAMAQAPQGVNGMIQAFQTWAATNSLTNASLFIARDGTEIGRATIGAWTIDTPAPIASTSKAITAVCLGTLIDSRQVALTDTIQFLLPVFTRSLSAVGQANSGRITVEQLLRHASGLEGNANLTPPREPTQVSYATGAAQTHPDEWFATQALNTPLFAVPGTTYAYANVNYAILGLIIRTVSGQAYETYCKNAVLTPRGASNAHIAAGNSAMEAFGGWTISAREYSSFYWHSFNRSALSDWATAFMDRVYDTSCTTCSYGLGVGVTAVGYGYSQVVYPMPEAVSVILTTTPHGKVMSPIVAGQDPLMLPILHPDIPPYDLAHTGDWTGATTPSQFSSIAMFWSNGVTAFVVCDRGFASAPNQQPALMNALSTSALTIN
jgi:CubicO group peptidase (beta-lactamase class C family)